jgi:hypothetical protein
MYTAVYKKCIHKCGNIGEKIQIYEWYFLILPYIAGHKFEDRK